jgi:hypothetical protein
MAKLPTTGSIAAGLSVPERVLLLCVASDTDWQRAGMKVPTARRMMIRGLIERGGSGFALSDQGRDVLEILMLRAAARGQ